MGIDISTLGLPKAVIGTAGGVKRSYKIGSEQTQQALRDAKENGEMRDLLEISGMEQGRVTDMAERAGNAVRHISNYSASAFFSRDMPDGVETDDGYTVGGAHFTHSELQQARQVLQAAAGSITAGPGRNTNLDYRNYAQMAIAENAVAAYASKSGLNAEQQRAVTGAMREYNDGLVQMQDDLLGMRASAEDNGYYSRPHVLSQAEADMLNSFKAQLSEMTGRQFSVSRAGEAAGYDQIAVNRPLISQITSLFARADLSERMGMDKTLQSYAQLVRPAYLAQGIGQAHIDEVLENDIESLRGVFGAIIGSARAKIDIVW